METFFDIAARQRACRHFLPTPLPDVDLRRILQAATYAPSSENLQPWVFVLVQAPEIKSELGDIMRELWASGDETAERAAMDASIRRDVTAGFAGALAAAPHMIVVGADARLIAKKWLPSSIFPAVQNLLLAAYAAGAASALTTIATIWADRVRAAVGFPAYIEPMAIVPIGYPAKALKPPRRDPVETRVHADRFGRPWATRQRN